MASKSLSFQGAGLLPRSPGKAPKSQDANLFLQNIRLLLWTPSYILPYLPGGILGTFEAAFFFFYQPSKKKKKKKGCWGRVCDDISKSAHQNTHSLNSYWGYETRCITDVHIAGASQTDEGSLLISKRRGRTISCLCLQALSHMLHHALTSLSELLY